MVDPSLLTPGDPMLLVLLTLLGCPSPDPVPETGHDTDAGLTAADGEE